MSSKQESRIRRSRKTRIHIKKLDINRLSVFRSSQHIYAQLLGAKGKVLATASTAEPTVKKSLKSCGNIKAAEVVGKLIAERAVAAGVKVVAFDRSGYKYHGRVKALADAARAGGLEF